MEAETSYCDGVHIYFVFQTFIDFTFGSGGHTRALLNACQDIKIFCIDRDPVAYDYAKELSNSAIG